MRAFEEFNHWPCPNVAAAAIDASGAVHVHGDTAATFRLASITKLFTAAATHLAVEEGSISLDDVADDRGATISDLLAHSSGLGPAGERLDKPGRRRVYSNAGYEELADLLAKASDMTFEGYLSEGVFEALNMTSTRLEGSPAFGAESTVDDLVKFVKGLPALLAATTIEQMTNAYLPELIGVLPGYGRQVPNTWGLGPEVRYLKSPHWTGTNNSPRTWGHFGASGTFVWTDPDASVSLIVLTDRPFGDWAIPRWPTLSDAVLLELS